MNLEQKADIWKSLNDEMSVKIRRLLIRGWNWENGLWSNPDHTNQGLLMLFTFEQAVKAEGL